MKPLIKTTVFIGVTAGVVWSIPPARRYLKNKIEIFSSAYRDAQTRITAQLLHDVPILNETDEFRLDHHDDWKDDLF